MYKILQGIQRAFVEINADGYQLRLNIIADGGTIQGKTPLVLGSDINEVHLLVERNYEFQQLPALLSVLLE